MAYKVLYDFYSFLLLKVLFIQLEKTNKTVDDQIPFPKENTDYESHDIFPALFFFFFFKYYIVSSFFLQQTYILSLRKLSQYISTYNRI